MTITDRPRAPTIRSQLILEMASALSEGDDPSLRQARVLLRGHDKVDWPICLDSISTPDAIEAVVSGRSTLAMMNPSAILTLAYRGRDPYTSPQPVRTLCTIPSRDAFAFAVTRETGLSDFEDIARQRFPLKISMRAQQDHCMHMVFDHIAQAVGFSRHDLASWGGEIRYDGVTREPKKESLARGANAVFDEAIDHWLQEAIDDGMTILSLSEATLQKLEEIGYRRMVLRQKAYPQLPRDVNAIDFSGWTVFVREDLPDDLVRRMCAAINERRDYLRWEGPGPIPIERMCRDTPDTPLGVPLHSAAERFWRDCGYV